ncbi:glycosyltransferase [Paenibacillus jiagnxiensis]|uniref:glycosyltransferase n=1 Tax=Paenibacillus jiagnxiensis TaxID=3228926 RepID=UPI0038D42D55
MIVRNEEEVLENCLNSVADLVDEIIIVDTGSTDRTKDIAKRFNARIFDYTWTDHFADARNFAFQQATQAYILWLDADDVLMEEDRGKLRKLKATLDYSVDAISMFYNTGFDLNGNVTFRFRRHRIVKRECYFKWHGAVHEYLQVGGNILTTDIAVSHRKHSSKALPKSDRNLRIYERLIAEGRQMTPRDLFYYANELREHGQAEKALEYYEKFLETGQGWVEDEIRACQFMADCYSVLGRKEESLLSCLRSFTYDRPRPDSCCTIGDHFLTSRKYEAAIYWYEQALEFEGKDLPGFSHMSLTTWYPYLQLCVCHWNLGNLSKAKECNEKAAAYRPDHFSVIHNRKLFEEKEV